MACVSVALVVAAAAARARPVPTATAALAEQRYPWDDGGATTVADVDAADDAGDDAGGDDAGAAASDCSYSYSYDDAVMSDCVRVARGCAPSARDRARCSTPLWPLPRSYSAGSVARAVAAPLAFELVGDARDSAVLVAAAERYAALLFPHGAYDPTYDDDAGSAARNGSRAAAAAAASDGAVALARVRIVVQNASDATFELGADESYALTVGADGETDDAIRVAAPTVFGALHALETLSQLVQFRPGGAPDSDDDDAGSPFYEVHKTPLAIADAPRFRYRGVMVDCARHFMPVRDLERTVDAMAAAKLNVLHLHLSDRESFAVQSRAHSRLWRAAFSRSERYTTADLERVVAYAHARGVAVLPEIDTPSHSKSLCAGAPPTVCMETCAKSDNWPLRPVERSFRFLHSLWAELDAVFPFAARHVGGDEVETKCWETDAVSAKWMEGAKLTDAETWVYFLNRNVNMSLDAGRRAIAWNDAFRDYGDAVSSRATLIFWTSNPTNGMQAAADRGMDVISASGNPNYLSNANDYTVRQMYDYDPCDCGNGVNALACVNTTAACAKVLGIEAAFWTSDYDASQLDNGLWPRTAALAERGWSVPGLRWYTPDDDDDDAAADDGATTAGESPTTATRLGAFRCLLLQRGVAAMPTTVAWDNKYGSARAGTPGSCMVQ